MANSVWLSSYVCPVARAVTPVRVWCMMKRSWLVGQLTILTSIPHAPFVALRFCLCSMWTSETWVTRKGNLVCNHTIDISMAIFTISKSFLFLSYQIPLSRCTYLPDRHSRWTSTSLRCRWQYIQQWQKRPCKNTFLKIQFITFQCFGIIFWMHQIFIIESIMIRSAMYHIFCKINCG